MVSSASRAGGCVAAALLLTMIAGCTSTPAPSGAPETPTPAATVTPATTEATSSPREADLASFTIPDCEALLPIETVRSEFAEEAQYFDFDAGVPLSERMPSTEANEAMAQAVSELDCLWGLPESDVGFTLDVAIIPESAREELIPSLRDGDFTEAPLGSAQSFTHALDNDSGLWVTLYAFDGNAWVTYIGMGRSGTAADLTSQALENLKAANPGL